MMKRHEIIKHWRIKSLPFLGALRLFILQEIIQDVICDARYYVYDNLWLLSTWQRRHEKPFKKPEWKRLEKKQKIGFSTFALNYSSSFEINETS